MRMSVVELHEGERVWVTGDVHLRPEDSERARLFLRFLAEVRGSAHRLVLLGDVFDYWIGLGHGRSCAYSVVIAALEEMASAGIRIDFVSGNRDFLGHRGLDEIGVCVHGDAVLLSRGGRRAVVTHGDLLVKGDVSHRRYTKIVRSRPFRLACRLAPQRILQAAVRVLRVVSQQKLAAVASHEFPIDHERVHVLLARHGAQELLMGHLHREETHQHAGRVTRVLPGWGPCSGPHFILGSETQLRLFR